MRKPTFYAVPLEADESPDQHEGRAHFEYDSCIRQVHTYLVNRGLRYGGFAFPTVKDIQRHAYSKKLKRRYSVREVKRALRFLRELGVVSEYHARRLPDIGVRYGWQIELHERWTKKIPGFCALKNADRVGNLKMPVLPVAAEAEPMVAPMVAPKVVPEGVPGNRG